MAGGIVIPPANSLSDHMGKRDQHFEKVADFKAKFAHLSTEMIRYRLANFGTGMAKEAAIALRQLLEERELASEQSDQSATQR